ncbi:MAG: hypothetical protein P8Y03_03525 [Anaerolineales bacterium]|jgi:hypothetical protein
MLKKSLLTTFLLLVLATGACGRDRDLKPAPEVRVPTPGALENTYLVDPVFEDFYESLGGFDTLGPALTPLQNSGGLNIQYVQSALLLFDAQATQAERYRLAPLGIVFGIAEPAVPNPGVPDSRYVNGHVIYADFMPLYEQLGGARLAGRPLTEARYNPDKARIEQYFENLGFYRLENDPSGDVRLLAYGAFACDQRCRYQPPPASIPSLRPLLPEPFSTEVARLGLNFVGRTLSEPYINSDGQLEIIFENLVLVTEAEIPIEKGFQLPFHIWLPQIFASEAAPEKEAAREEVFRVYLPLILVTAKAEAQNGGGIRVQFNLELPLVSPQGAKEAPLVSPRPIVEQLGFEPQPPTEPSEDALMVFYPTEGDKGHNVPFYFNDYLLRHGGLKISGAPITEVYSYRDGIFRQCFENLCLDFDVTASADERLKPAPLGAAYKERFYNQANDFIKSQSLDNIHMQVWEGQSFVSSRDSQEIHVTVTENDVPLRNREPVLILTLPDNTRSEYHFPPTGDNGQTALTLDPISAPNGALIAYQVCLDGIGDDRLCVNDNFLIWNYP